MSMQCPYCGGSDQHNSDCSHPWWPRERPERSDETLPPLSKRRELTSLRYRRKLFQQEIGRSLVYVQKAHEHLGIQIAELQRVILEDVRTEERIRELTERKPK